MPDKTEIQELQKSYKAFLRKQAPRTPHFLVQRDTYLRAAFLGQWKSLEKEASRQRTRAVAGLQKLRPIQEELQRLNIKVSTLLDEANGVWKPLQGRNDWNEIQQKIEQKLQDTTTPAQAAALAKKLGALRISDLENRLLDPLERAADNLDEASESWHALLIGAELARVVAAFNQHTRVPLKSIGDLNNWLDRSAKTLIDHEKAIWQALRARDLQQLETASTALLRWSSGDVLDDAAKQASALARARKNSANRWQLGQQAMAVADLIRALLVAQALGHRTSWMAGSELGLTKEWCDAASRLAFPSRWKRAASLKASAIWARSRQLNGKQVALEGVAGPVFNAHRRRKVHSSAWISDSDGNSMRIGITHIKMDSGGVVEGAYVKAYGTFVAQDNDFDTPIIRLDQRSLTVDSDSSWTDWKVLHLRHLFIPVPHGITIDWSWEHGEYGAGNQLRYGTWLPFARGD